MGINMPKNSPASSALVGASNIHDEPPPVDWLLSAMSFIVTPPQKN